MILISMISYLIIGLGWLIASGYTSEVTILPLTVSRKLLQYPVKLENLIHLASVCRSVVGLVQAVSFWEYSSLNDITFRLHQPWSNGISLLW